VRFEPTAWAEVYDAPAPGGALLRFRHLADVARREVLAAARSGEAWLDLGCGTGHLSAQLAAAGLDVTAVDSDPAMVEAAATRFGDRGRLRFVVGDATALDFAPSTFDGVVATSLVGCLGESAPFFAEVQRVLRPGGRAVLTFTNRASLLNAFARRLRRRPSALAVAARGYTAREARRDLERAGLAVERVRFVNWFVCGGSRVFPPAPVAFRLDGPVGALVAWNIVVVAEKAPRSAADILAA
jgi:ubiquinone/menaquinone biosynthesis C-methylase UbiE